MCVCLRMRVCGFKNSRLGFSNPQELFRQESSLYRLNEKIMLKLAPGLISVYMLIHYPVAILSKTKIKSSLRTSRSLMVNQ